MKPVFANSAWVAAPERMILRTGRWRRRRLQVRYGLFVHPKEGPTLIDTGYTEHCLSGAKRSTVLRAYARVLQPQLVEEEQAVPFLARFNLTPADIRRVIVTHFHADHVAGLAAFPNARFSASGAAWDRLRRKSTNENVRHGVFPELIPSDFDTRLDAVEASKTSEVALLPDSYDLFGDGSVKAVPLQGHADGHFGLLYAQLDVPLLYATDTQWIPEALIPEGRPRLLPRLISDSYQDVARSSDHVVAFREAGGAVVLCHDDAPCAFDVAHGARL